MTGEGKDIEELRSKIAEVDSRILDVVAERMNLSVEIGRLKSLRGLDVEAKEVEELVVARGRACARELDIDEELAEKILRLLIEYSKREQRRSR
ncbi:MAG: chorismate mutase [Theionarchaea archaeon]|nr:chorismate mutase [Theionarchaea archaeon]